MVLIPPLKKANGHTNELNGNNNHEINHETNGSNGFSSNGTNGVKGKNGNNNYNICSEYEVFDTEVLVFYVNGKRIEDRKVDPRTTLAVYLRDHLHLTGTKIGCNEGGCGACTVMVSDVNPGINKIRHYSANSCLLPVCAVFGKAVTTVEGLGSVVEGRLHPVQERLAKAHGSQCGYCTPGFVMAMYSLLRNKPKPTEDDINEALQGNLCRCTGYRPILEAFYSFAVDESGEMKITENGCGMGEKCCKVNGNSDCGGGARKSLLKLTDLSDCAKYDPSQELIFPPELLTSNMHSQSFSFQAKDHRWFQPTDYNQLLELKEKYPHARIISGNSEVGVELKFRHINIQTVINPRQISALHTVTVSENKITFGTGLSITEMDDFFKQQISSQPEHKLGVILAAHNMIHWFAGKHIRNVASVAGNIATASPISDLNPIWMAAGAKVVLDSAARGPHEVCMDEKFFVGYRKTIIQQDEVIKAIVIPMTTKNQHFIAYKQAQRREDDISIVTGAFNATVNPTTFIVEKLSIAYAGMHICTKMALNTMKGLVGRKWDKSLLDDGLRLLSEEFALRPDVPGGMPRYRQALTLSFFLKFFLHVSKKLNLAVDHVTEQTSIGDTIPKKLEATQLYQEVPEYQPADDPVGRPLKHTSGDKHTTGKAIYATDTHVAHCLHAALVFSPIAAGKLVSVDATKALEMPGVVAFFGAKDLPTKNLMGHTGDTPVFVEETISYHGQPIGVIVAKDHETARRAADQVKVNCTSDVKAIVSIEDAIANDSFLGPRFQIHSQLAEVEENSKKEVVKADWSKYSRVVEGEIRMGGQEHFYLETHNCVVIPHEDNELEVIISSQGVNDIQIEIGKILNIPRHKIVVKVKRIGGGFGGKESAGSVMAVPAALAAFKLRQPVRIYLERFDDMTVTGTRHPFRFNYKAALSEDNKLLDYDITAYSNGGHTFDLSIGVMHRAMVHIDNVYKFGNAHIFGQICRTNTASNTAFRGFGGPQGMLAAETVMKHLAETYNIDVDELREKNFYAEGDCTPFGMHLRKCNISRTWDECRRLADYDKKKKEVAEFNSRNRFRKRGVYLLPTRFGIGFGVKFLNQASALVLVYTDGTVLISHGGMEMGQGLHTKMLQVAARCLGIPMEMIHISDTSTDKVPNSSATAASVGSDLNGYAVQDACQQLMDRLKPFKESNTNGTWQDWVMAAYQDRVSLSATGFGIIHCEPVDFFNGRGAEMFGYCVYGTACCEVEVDCLSGDHHLLSTDIVMDVGDSLNPAIDIGQIEGAFVQGYGLFTMEELKIRPNGIRLSRGPGVYKIPSADDAPRKFHVSLLKGSSNPMAIFASKAIGEPPLFLGSCAYFAIREAVRAYRIQQGLTDYFRFDSPATAERIRLACEDEITNKIADLPEDGSFTPWTVPL